jgi:hypothetical protein
MEGIAKAKSSSRIPIRFWSQDAATHLPWAHSEPLQIFFVSLHLHDFRQLGNQLLAQS